MIKQKRGMKSWHWILIILALVAIGIIIYSLMSGDSSSFIGGNSIPSPPSLPD